MNSNDVIFVTGQWRVTRDEYAGRVARAVSVLKDLGIGNGDVIGVALRNRPQFFELAAAATFLGAKSVPIAWRLKHDEIAYLIEDSTARVVFFDEASAPHMEGLPGVSLDEYEKRLSSATATQGVDVAESGFVTELYSSGTTGRPKAIERDMPEELLRKTAKTGVGGFLQMLGVGDSDEVHLVCGPLYHSQPVGFATSAILAGQKVVLMEGGFDAEKCLQAIDTEKVTWMTCVPTHLIRILALPEEVKNRYDLSSVKAILHSASPCPKDVKARAIELFPDNTIWEVYGGTEGAMTMISPQEWLKKPGSVGRPFMPGTNLVILDEHGNRVPQGKVGLVYAPSPMKFRYRNSPEQNSETWRGDLFTLGDMGYLDEDGYLFLTDRKKDMIITGGANVYPAEVEATLFNHPAIVDVAVIGVPDKEFGEAVKAIVELKSEASEEDIIAFCRDNLAHYKCPKSIDFIAEMPRDPNGKVRKRHLREPYWANEERRV